MKVHDFNHGELELDAKDIRLLRKIFPNESTDHPGGFQSTVFTDSAIYTMETVDQLVQMANAERPTPLSTLDTPNPQYPVFFAGEQADGPLRLSVLDIRDGVHSAFFISALANKRGVRVSNTPQEVHDVILAAGGKVRPVLEPYPATHADEYILNTEKIEFDPLPPKDDDNNS